MKRALWVVLFLLVAGCALEEPEVSRPEPSTSELAFFETAAYGDLLFTDEHHLTLHDTTVTTWFPLIKLPVGTLTIENTKADAMNFTFPSFVGCSLWTEGWGKYTHTEMGLFNIQFQDTTEVNLTYSGNDVVEIIAGGTRAFAILALTSSFNASDSETLRTYLTNVSFYDVSRFAAYDAMPGVEKYSTAWYLKELYASEYHLSGATCSILQGDWAQDELLEEIVPAATVFLI